MTKSAVVLLGAGFVVLVIIIAVLINGCPEIRRVKIDAPNGTQVFARLPDDSEKPLGDLAEAPLTVDIRADATIILRYKGQEKIFPPAAWENGAWENGKIVWQPAPPARSQVPPAVVSVSINAVPWAEVFIKLPGTDRFVKPPNKESNITPIRGGLKVPIGTEIKLVYEGQVKTFGYEAWKTSKTISHDFSKP